MTNKFYSHLNPLLKSNLIANAAYLNSGIQKTACEIQYASVMQKPANKHTEWEFGHVFDIKRKALKMAKLPLLRAHVRIVIISPQLRNNRRVCACR
jgi:hypothetical protein